MKEAEIGGKLQTAKKTWVSIYKENKDFRVGRVESRSLEWLIDEKHIFLLMPLEELGHVALS